LRELENAPKKQLVFERTGAPGLWTKDLYILFLENERMLPRNNWFLRDFYISLI
jgi:hypothetical protein